MRTQLALSSSFLLSLLTCVVGCGVDPADDLATSAEAISQVDPTAGSGSYVTDEILRVLDARAGVRWGKTWNVTADNRLAPGWLVQTPPAAHWGHPYASLAQPRSCTGGDGCEPDFQLLRCEVDADCGEGGRCTALAASVKRPGDAPVPMCAGHSEVLVDEIYEAMIAGREVVDVTSLLPPDGRFIPAVRNAITYLGHQGRPMTVRLLFGAFPVQGVVNSRKVLQQLTRDLSASAPIEVFVGNFRSRNLPPSWNHSKMVVADGRSALVGGHNMWTQHYLDKDPVHDLSMRVEGSAAADAHRFANELWTWTCSHRSLLTWTTWSVWSNRWKAGAIDSGCKASVTPPPTTPAGNATVISVGRLGWVDPADAGNDADLAMLALLRAARHTIALSQQDFGPPMVPVLGLALGRWPNELFDELGAALARGVDIYIVLSNVGSVAGGLTAVEAPYANGWSLEQVLRTIRKRLIDHPTPGVPTGAALDELLCRHLHLAPFRFGPDDAFTDGVPFPNHAKLIMVDDRAAYIGSQNAYTAGLSEYGYIVDDAAAVGEVRRTYWQNVWSWSSRLAVSGTGAARCVLAP